MIVRLSPKLYHLFQQHQDQNLKQLAKSNLYYNMIVMDFETENN